MSLQASEHVHTHIIYQYTIPDNIALNKSAYQIGLYGGTSGGATADKAVDGHYDSNNNDGGSYLSVCAHPDTSWHGNGSAIWWVDLGDTYSIYNVTVYNTYHDQGNKMNHFTLEVVMADNRTNQSCGVYNKQDPFESETLFSFRGVTKCFSAKVSETFHLPLGTNNDALPEDAASGTPTDDVSIILTEDQPTAAHLATEANITPEHNREENPYINTIIPVSQFESYVGLKRSDGNNPFGEFKSLPQTDHDRYNIAITDDNKKKNRFLNIYPYRPQSYVNSTPYANFQRKCDRYWPEAINQSETWQEFTVTFHSLVEYADYIIRTLTLNKEGESRQITQYHFTSWKDKGKPSYGAITLLNFHGKVHANDDDADQTSIGGTLQCRCRSHWYIYCSRYTPRTNVSRKSSRRVPMRPEIKTSENVNDPDSAEHDRPYLTMRNEFHNHYINAVYVDSFKNHNYYVVTQLPLPNTKIDFWRLVYDHDYHTVVMLNELDESDETCCQYWPNEGSEIYGPMEVKLESTTNISDKIVMREFVLNLALNQVM
ncbi:hypothetical protein LSH36_4g21028 [Paralvinella palmiformis]|uniref:Tyrosine-protein phosphatase domain-containing protein n=1 Tax=Paralvinella palmiformis TaxID=53620 RepID=A0AAD9KEF3_9ANNE|nr:hypothetical protein LSH36_4g21028 [Paralvinella palmiformis]